MKTAISATSGNIDAPLDKRFGRADYFLIVQMPEELLQVIQNKDQAPVRGAGIAMAQTIVENQVDVVITGQVGPNAMRVLKAAGIRMVAGIPGSVRENLQWLSQEKLERIQEHGPSHTDWGSR